MQHAKIEQGPGIQQTLDAEKIVGVGRNTIADKDFGTLRNEQRCKEIKKMVDKIVDNIDRELESIPKMPLDKIMVEVAVFANNVHREDIVSEIRQRPHLRLNFGFVSRDTYQGTLKICVNPMKCVEGSTYLYECCQINGGFKSQEE